MSPSKPMSADHRRHTAKVTFTFSWKREERCQHLQLLLLTLDSESSLRSSSLQIHILINILPWVKPGRIGWWVASTWALLKTYSGLINYIFQLDFNDRISNNASFFHSSRPDICEQDVEVWTFACCGNWLVMHVSFQIMPMGQADYNGSDGLLSDS